MSQTEPRLISNETMELVKIFTEVSNALIRAQVLVKEHKITGPAKHWINTSIINRLVAMHGDMKYNLGDAIPQARELFDVETNLQTEATVNMLIALPPGIQSEVCSYIESRYETYRINR